ncbi:hypothetical protein BDN72DRAFT_900504 [Pluteus cervinus]|uniref:Uncharacterized protein n=1 Tax=Pluteus cervinus TaxID=181527 RepID=A0ACD3AIT1_9AGAR|nr:hypothetical protein BDN72DRAFT_900504 [Pluteus cervinus]
MLTPEKLLARENYGAYAPFQVIFPNHNLLPHHRWVFEKQAMKEEEMDTIIESASKLHQHHRPDILQCYERKRACHLEPSREEALVIQNYLQEYEQEVLRATETVTNTISKIASLCRELSDATCQLAFRATQRDVCKYLLSPIHHIHDDILQEIFLACLDSEDSTELSSNRAPLQLAAVCHRWRNVAISFPRLWRNIYVTHRRRGSFPLGKTWIRRCGYASLALHIDNDDESDWNGPLSSLLHGVRESPVQFKRLDLRFNSKRTANEVLPQLLYKHSNQVDVLAVNTLFDVPIPQVQELRLYLHEFPKDIAFPLPLFPQLTFLRIESEMHPSMLEVILFHCPNLHKVSVSLETNHTPPPFNPVREEGEQRVHSRLQHLGISNDGLRLPLDFLGHFSFPSLRVIEFYSHVFRSDTAAWLVSHPSLHQLRRLVLQFPQDTGFLLARIFASAESLEELTLDSFQDTFMTALMETLTNAPSSNETFLPSLKRLHLSVRTREVLLSPQLNNLVRVWSTQKQRRPLSGIYIHYARSSLGYEERAKVLELQSQEGLEVRVDFNHIADMWDSIVPWMFGLYPLAFNETRTLQVLEADGTVGTRSGPFYEVE